MQTVQTVSKPTCKPPKATANRCKPYQKGGGLEAPLTPPWNVWFATVCSDCCRFAGRFAGGLHGLLLLSLPIDHGIEDRGILATRLRFQSPAGAPQELAGACPGPVDHAQGPLDAPRCICRGLFMPLAAFAGAIRCWRPRLQWGFYAPRSFAHSIFCHPVCSKKACASACIFLFEAILFAFPNMARYLTTDLAPSSCCTFPPPFPPPHLKVEADSSATRAGKEKPKKN